MASRLRSRKDVLLLPDWEEPHVAPALGRSPAAEDQVLLGVEYGDLAVAMRRLSPEFRSVVQAVVLDGLTTKEAGRLLGVRENTVKTRLHRAKAQLRGSLAGAGEEGWR
jgi:RNA polymerase sigma-70 factor (ECF subfamily)